MMTGAALDRPIGVYDSGIGGLSVLNAIQAELPNESLIYVADSAYVPYGEKSRHLITARGLAIAEYFVSRGAKAMAVPCNTATAAAILALRERYPHLPIVGIEPAVRPAARLTRSRVIGVFATTGTLASQKFQALVQREAPDARIVLRSCPEWVMGVENGIVSGVPAIELVKPAVNAVLAEGADVLVLGCTHFPFLGDAIRHCAGPDIPVLETSAAVARQLKHQLLAYGLARVDGTGTREFLTSGDPVALQRQAGRLLGTPVSVEVLPERYR